MPILNANQNLTAADPLWCFLAEFSLREFLADHDRSDELTAGVLFQTVQELGIPAECVRTIEMTLAGFAKEALEHIKPGKQAIRGRIRVFCQKKVIDDANSARSTAPAAHIEHALEPAQAIPSPGAKMMGGWSYFLIEKGGNGSTVLAGEFWYSVDLYLYKEGE